MSTEPLPPNYYDRNEPPPPRRRSWKRIMAWIAGILIVLIAILWIGTVALLNNNEFRQYLLRVAQTRLSETTGIALRMRDFSIHLSGLSPAVDMYDVVVDGAEPYPRPPLLKVDHLSVGIQIVSLLQHKWYLKDIVINHPVARVFVSENGDTNLPKTKSSGQNTNAFDLGVRHVMLGQGEIYYNDQKSTLDADIQNLQFEARFDPGPKRYSGGLRYTDGKIHFQNLNPLVHSLEGEFDATQDTFILKRSLLKTGSSQLSLTATVNDYAHPKIDGAFQSTLDTGELRQVLKDATLPVGVIQLTGFAKFESDPNKPVMEALTLNGNVSSGGLQIHTTTIHTLVRDVSARYLLQHGDVELRDVRAALLGGGMNGSFKLHDITGAQVSELHANLRGIALASIQALVNAQAMRDFRLTGTADAKVDASWRKVFDNLTVHTDATAAGTLDQAGRQTPSPQPIVPIEASIHGDYSAPAETASFSRSYIKTPQMTANLNGTVSRTASLQVQVQSNDLGEIETIADAFGATSQPLGLGGMATFIGTVRGSTSNPQISGQFSAPTLKFRGTEWRSVRTSVDANPSHVVLRNGDFSPANNRGRITFNVDLGLDQWAFRETSPVQIDANASQLNVADLKNLAGVQAPVTGILSVNVSLHGSQLNPIGRGSVTLTQATVADEPVQSANLDLQGTGDEVRVRLGLRMPAGTAQTNFTYFPKRRAYDGELQATGIRLDQLRNLRARNVNIAGTLNINAKGSGTFEDPRLQFTAQIPQLQIQNETVNGITLEANVADHVANLAVNSQSQTLNTFVRGRGRVNLTGDYETDAAFDTSTISLQPLLALYLSGPTADVAGQTEVHGTVRGPLKDSTRLEVHFTIPTLSVSYGNNAQLAAVQPIQLDYSRGVLTLQKTTIRGTGTDLQLQGTIPMAGSAPMAVVALGTIDLGIGQLLNPDITSSGQIQFNIDGTGRRSDPNVQGKIKIVNAAFAGDSLPLGLQNGNGVLTLTNTRLDIDSFQGKVSGGTVTATGGITYRPAIQFNVALTGNDIRTLYPQGVREGMTANLTFVGSTQTALLRGQVQLTELSFSPSFDLADIVSVVSEPTGSTAPPGGFARNLNLDINVVSANELNLASSKLSLQGATNLRIRGTAAQPAVIGRVNITGGDLIFRGNRYVIENGTLDFVDPYSIEPRVNLAVSTRVQEYDIRMLFRGTVDKLRTTYTSEPVLPPSDIINLLVFGKTTEAQAANPTPGNLGAESMIASSVSSQVTNRIEKIAGISQLSVDPILGSNQHDPGARITIQQRVTGNVFVTFSTDAASTQREVITLQYQATPTVGLSGFRDQNGGFAFDVRIKKTW